jgi:hypothetical protein
MTPDEYASRQLAAMRRYRRELEERGMSEEFLRGFSAAMAPALFTEAAGSFLGESLAAVRGPVEVLLARGRRAARR